MELAAVADEWIVVGNRIRHLAEEATTRSVDVVDMLLLPNIAFRLTRTEKKPTSQTEEQEAMPPTESAWPDGLSFAPCRWLPLARSRPVLV